MTMLRNRLYLMLVMLAMAALPLAATTAEMYFSFDKNGGTRVTKVQEGTEIWICVYDPDENIDCDVRDKMSPDVKLWDPKTGASIIWNAAPGSYTDEQIVAGGYDYLEETGANTGLFVSSHAFQIGTRESFSSAQPWKATHVVDVPSMSIKAPKGKGTQASGEAQTATDAIPKPASPVSFLAAFKWGAYLYTDLHNETGATKGGVSPHGDWLQWVGFITNNSVAFGTGLVDLPLSACILPSDLDGNRAPFGTDPARWLIGRFENMDTLIGMVQDPNDDTDVAVAMMKIVDTEATIDWNREIYKDGNEAATITVVDADENLNCNRVEVVPVFILVNPGSWNPVNSKDGKAEQTGDSPNNFCMLKRTGGIDGSHATVEDPALPATAALTNRPIRWFNIYNAEKNDYGTKGAKDGRYYIQYPKLGAFDIEDHGTLFETTSANGVTAVSFYATETGSNTGVFELRLNSILADLGFSSLNVRDVLVAYYLDPNDEDDFKLTTAYIEERHHSTTSFTNPARQDQELYWLGRDALYLQVIDANANVDPCCPEQVVVHLCDPHDEDDGEFYVLDETSPNSPTFFSNAGMELLPVWDALGVGLPNLLGGYQLVLDNWKLEAFNEDEIYARYNDVYYVNNDQGMVGLGDVDTYTAYSGPRIDRVRVENDVSFDLMSVADTQVYDGSTTQMHFLDRQGNRVSGYVNSDCVFIEVVDADQDEDRYRRERVDGFWDGGQNLPFGPLPLNAFDCTPEKVQSHPVNILLGDTNILGDSPDPYSTETADYLYDGAAKIYVLNPRSGRWAALDLLETGVATGDFVSVICVDLTAVYGCVPTLDVLPGDTIVAFYQDPSNHSDSAMISIKVSVGGGAVSPGSATAFVDANGGEVLSYAAGDLVYVKVTDLSHTQDVLLPNAVVIQDAAYDLTTFGSQSHMFITEGIALDLAAGDVITATYADPSDPTDTSSDTITVIACELVVESFYAGPNPFSSTVSFSYKGSGIATTFSVKVYDLTGRLVWSREQTNVTEVVWDGTNGTGAKLANGPYIYVLTATDGTHTFSPGNTPSAKGTVFVNR